ncbi:MAG: energy transducer TonB [Betaproteobacteria bacterium]|nr:energy transducer TonB [Betaproteobacteria bacterium]
MTHPTATLSPFAASLPLPIPLTTWKHPRSLGLAGVVALHTALLAAIVLGTGHHTEAIKPPQAISLMILAQPATTAPKPLPVAAEIPRTSPLPVIVPEVAIALQNREPLAAPTTPTSRVSEAPTDPVASQASTATTTAPTAPVITPPRTDASQLNNPAPAYPALSRRLGEQGRVLFDVLIRADGRVGEIKLKQSSGYPRLDEAAQEALRRWRYLPARQGDTPIDYWYSQAINFSLG